MTHDEFERIVMNKLLEGSEDFLVALREQYSKATIASREFTGVGFFTTFDVPSHLAYGSLKGRIFDVEAIIPGYDSYFFILYIENGIFDVLEGFSTLDWKEYYEEAEVVHFHEDRREFDLKE